jgi:hypothetical protein
VVVGAELAALERESACADPLPEVRNGARAEGDVHERVLLEDAFALRLRIAATHGDHEIGPLAFTCARVAEIRSEPSVRLLADGARVEHDDVCLLGRGRLPEPEGFEHAFDPLGVVGVHLAAERGHVVTAHQG